MLGGNKEEQESRIGSKWEEERREFFEDRGLEEIERRKELGEEWCGDLIGRGKERDRKERWERIENSKFNRLYKVIKRRESRGI